MKVIDGLLPVISTVEDRAVAVLQPFLFGQMLGYDEEVPDQRLVLFGDLVDGGDGLARHDKDVRGRLRVDIVKSDALIVFVHDIGRHVAINDFLE